MSLEARRLQARAGGEIQSQFRPYRQPSPSQELREAKRALHNSGMRLQGDVNTVLVPVAAGMQCHPWRTLGLSVAGGAMFGWADKATHGALSRVMWRVLRTGLHARGLRLP